MDTARTVNIKFNKDKLQCKEPEVKYVGQYFSAQEMKVDTDRIKSLIALKPSTYKKDLCHVRRMFIYIKVMFWTCLSLCPLCANCSEIM